ncbi:helix-turn-helix domain-containing protein [Burkholderia pseudomallei]|uniref:helix-turn-helix domain-containing protein n=1 Tax=Burkholderia pseudomallei TaxID=28450 RepID=UPI001A9FF175|nr:helix-turn-helix domain-containing protein [Burkholderia pseudomallei]QTB53380.1 helix-turn-helix domain-containing protein [Burkholderia pseudomallei]
MIVIERIDTMGVTETERVTYWQDVIRRIYCQSESIIPLNAARDFRAFLSQQVFGHVGIGHVEAPAVAYSRKISDVRQSPSEDFLVSILEAGDARIEQNGKRAIQNCGDIVIYDTARPFDYEFLSDYKITLLSFPRSQMLHRIPNIEKLTAVPINTHSQIGALASTVIRGAAQMDPVVDASARAKIGSSVIDIFSAAVEMELCSGGLIESRQIDVLERAKRYITGNLSDSSLDISKIANAIGISNRTLNRAFAAEGTTAVRWLWQARLRECYMALNDGRMRRVSDIASAYGFNDVSHFNRAFKLMYGVTPTSIARR